jgi:hypothetical protein
VAKKYSAETPKVPEIPDEMRTSIATGIVILFLMGGTGWAQWVGVPLPGVPRTPDGKPNLAAPAPKTPDGKPDLTGVWRNPDAKYLNNLAADGVEVSFTPWAAALYKERQANFSKGRPSESCLPHGIPDAMMVPAAPFKIIQTPGVVVILHENQNRFRQIFTDGRGFPEEMTPAWLGYSIGKWNGDTLVVESAGFNDRSWLDDGGHPHSDALRVTEQYRRPDFGHLDYEITFDDPKAYTKSWTSKVRFDFFPDTEIMEWVCENEKDAARSVGK